MKYLVIIPLLALTLIYSCTNNNGQTASTQLQFGNTTGMDVVTFNKTVYGYNVDSLNIDVNHNSTVDFKFNLYLVTTGSAQDQYFLRIYSPSKEVTVNGFFIADTSYYHLSTITTLDNNSTKVWITSESNYSCSRLDPSDVVSATTPSNFKIAFYSPNQNLSSADMYNDEFDFPIFQGQSGGVPLTTSVSGDTTFIATNRYNLNCHTIPNGDKYIGFKIKSTGKLGWIKLRALNINSFRLIEIATQI